MPKFKLWDVVVAKGDLVDIGINKVNEGDIGVIDLVFPDTNARGYFVNFGYYAYFMSDANLEYIGKIM